MNMSFKCQNCGREVVKHTLGTKHRNHCPFCLWSKHLDMVPGDRRMECRGLMEPIGLTFKREGGKKQGELMLVHRCSVCGGIGKNRIAGDDDEKAILAVFEMTKDSPTAEVESLTEADRREIITQIFGKPYAEKYFL